MSHRSTWITPDDAAEALRIGTGRGIKVAILDSGIELSHPRLRHLRLADDIAFKVSEAGVVTRAPGLGTDEFGHGTAIAGVLLRAAPDVQIGSFRVLDHRLVTEGVILEEAARLAIDRGYHILNLSMGVAFKKDSTPKWFNHFKPWIDAAYRRGVHVVTACCNEYFRKPEWPSNFPTVIAVNMAKTLSDDLYFRWDARPGGGGRGAADSTESAAHLVEFAARGVDLELAWNNSRTITDSGSSYAAPHVAGLLARLLSCYPGLKPPVAKALLQEIAQDWTPAMRGPNR